MRALFEIALRKRWPLMTRRLLTLCKVIDKRLWDFAHPLRQFPNLSPVVLRRLEEKKLTVDKLKEMRKDDIGECRVQRPSTALLCSTGITAAASVCLMGSCCFY